MCPDHRVSAAGRECGRREPPGLEGIVGRRWVHGPLCCREGRWRQERDDGEHAATGQQGKRGHDGLERWRMRHEPSLWRADRPAVPPMIPRARRGKLLQVLGVSFGVAVLVGNTILIGILRTPGDVAARLPSPALFIGVWIIGGLYALLGAISLAEPGAMVARSGGQYVDRTPRARRVSRRSWWAGATGSPPAARSRSARWSSRSISSLWCPRWPGGGCRRASGWCSSSGCCSGAGSGSATSRSRS